MKTTKWAIVGLGKIAHKLAQDIQLVKGVELVAVASRDIDKAAKFAEEYGVTNYYGDYKSLLNQENIDLVYIATPHVFHTPLSKMFIENGFSVLCEKPISMNHTELQELTELAKSKNVFLMEAIWTRFFPTFRKALEIVKSGELGEITAIKADFGFHSRDNDQGRIFNKKLGGGALLDVGLYPIFLSLMVMGEPDEILADSTWTKTEVDASTSMIFKYGQHCIADLFCSVVAETDVEGEIFGTKGRLKLHSRFHHAEKLTWQIYGEEMKEFNATYTGNGYQFEIEEVHQCLVNGKMESKLMPLSLSRDLCKTMDRVREICGINYE